MTNPRNRLRQLPLHLWVFLRESPKSYRVRTWIKEFPPSAFLIARGQRHQALKDLRHRDALLGWSLSPDCPHPLYDAAGATIGERLYVIRGYRRADAVNAKIFVFDLRRKQWLKTIEPPDRLPHSHMSTVKTVGHKVRSPQPHRPD